jgi:hypothetical protein
VDRFIQQEALSEGSNPQVYFTESDAGGFTAEDIPEDQRIMPSTADRKNLQRMKLVTLQS